MFSVAGSKISLGTYPSIEEWIVSFEKKVWNLHIHKDQGKNQMDPGNMKARIRRITG
ncbi:MAG: hypothetical protein LUP99_04060 [Methanomicrobiales archaeon]|nr:hypothetical protein [Methanomicrobiales archaeon]